VKLDGMFFNTSFNQTGCRDAVSFSAKCERSKLLQLHNQKAIRRLLNDVGISGTTIEQSPTVSSFDLQVFSNASHDSPPTFRISKRYCDVDDLKL
jgi:hypothetical protein